MLERLATLATAILFPFLCLYCVGHSGPEIQSRLRTDVDAALKAAPIPGVAVNVDGRDVTLTGGVRTDLEKQKAGYIAEATWGVRSVDNQLLVAPVSSAAAQAAQAKLNKILTDRIEFQINSDVLLSASIPVLNQALTVLRELPELKATVEGYTDNSAGPAINGPLSTRRAQAVARWLESNGIAPGRLKARGLGQQRPVAPNTTEAGRALNQRVEIHVE